MGSELKGIDARAPHHRHTDEGSALVVSIWRILDIRHGKYGPVADEMLARMSRPLTEVVAWHDTAWRDLRCNFKDVYLHESNCVEMIGCAMRKIDMILRVLTCV